MKKQSVILRGSLSFSKRPGAYAQNVIDSIRSWFDGELILSTWENQLEAARGLVGLDKVVISQDPGDGPLQQMARQLVTYWAGVQASTGSEIMVTRTDIAHFRNLFKYLGSNRKFSSHQLCCFKEKLIIGNIMTISPNSSERVRTFRPCDWFQVGLRADIERWAGIVQNVMSIPKAELDAAWNQEIICTEKLWFTSVLRNHRLPDLAWNNTAAYDDLAWPAIIDNFLVLDQIQTARSINLNWAFQPQRLNCYVTENQYQHMQDKLCK